MAEKTTDLAGPELVDDWLAALRDQGKQPATLTNYRRALAHLAGWLADHTGQPFDPAACLPRDIAAWQRHQQISERAKPATLNPRRAAAGSFFNWAAARGLVAANPVTACRPVRPEPRRPRALSRSQANRLRRQVYAAGSARDAAMLELLLGAGLRVGELLALRRGDLDLGERRGQVTIRAGKGGQFRVVPLVHEVRQALRSYLDSLTPPPEEADPLWRGERGPLRSRSAVLNMLKNHARAAGLPADRISPHVLRHTFSTFYLERNPGDLRGLAALLGHASLGTTLIYTEPTPAALARRLEAASTGSNTDNGIND